MGQDSWLELLLISRDPSFLATVVQAAADLPLERICHLKSYSEAEQSCAFLRPGVIICHIQNAADRAAACRLAQELRTQGSTASLLAISGDEYCVRKSYELVKHGFLESLSPPIDWDRLRFWLGTKAASLCGFRPLSRETSTDEAMIQLAQSRGFSCRSSGVRQVLRSAIKVAQRDSCVIIRGKSGTGKTMLASLLHDLSPRKNEPFVHVNCGAIPEHLAESELFGHRKGAFTGADSDREGKFSLAGKGTLFLDEIETLSLATQAKLLRGLDQRVFELIGSNTPQKLEARVIAATNAALEEKVRRGEFRADLYYRLKVIELTLPPLCEVREEIPALVEYHVERLAREFGMPTPRVQPQVIALLEKHDWPGNFRELINTLERVMSFLEGDAITLEDLPELDYFSSGDKNGAKATPQTTPHVRVETPTPVDQRSPEYHRIMHTLNEANYNKTLAAQLLGISRVSLYKKLDRLGLSSLVTSVK
jgi:DNA-binding NtrC family response regulator